ncbi:MAG: chorismate mutase [Oscillospiraceae bacterium]|nr:chorismate mutase [Oscillospiraceae bacterium]
MGIEELRREINGVDDQLLKLFARRMEIVSEIGRYKKERSLPVLDREREQKTLHRLREQAPPEFAGYVEALFTSLFEISRDYQESRI